MSNLKLDSREAIQPIFLMPKPDAAAQKPVYIPRNIYVPVIRPVFVPRERIIVRPQIIHVARPVLVDRPVPVQQRPIVIGRDSFNDNNNISNTTNNNNNSSTTKTTKSDYGFRQIHTTNNTTDNRNNNNNGGNNDGQDDCCEDDCGEITQNIETAQEVTYHEFTRTYPDLAVDPCDAACAEGGNAAAAAGSGGEEEAVAETTYIYDEKVEYEEDEQRKQEVIKILEEAERRKSSTSSSSSKNNNNNNNNNENVSQQYDTAKVLDSMLGNNPGYTLEVLDQRVSDKFEKTDTETIKARYGVDSFQYLPPGGGEPQAEEATAAGSNSRARTGSYKSAGSAGGSSSNVFESTTNKSIGSSRRHSVDQDVHTQSADQAQ